MKVHREEGRFVVRIELAAEFNEDYEGDDDGYAWLRAWQERVRPKLLGAIFQALRSEPGFEAIPVSRGASPESEAEVQVRFKRG